jgi:hypothetical protein
VITEVPHARTAGIERTDVMTTLATTSKTIRLALALTVLTPVPLLAQALTAREMLAQAQNQAVTLPGETKKSGTTEMAKLEVGKPEPTRPQPVKAQPQVELAPPMPVIAPAAPEQPTPAALNSPVPLDRVSSDSPPAMPTPDSAKPSPAPAVVQAAPPAPVSVAPAPAAVSVAPIAAASPAPTSPAPAPAPQTEARVPQPAPVAPHARVARPDPAPAAVQTKSRHEQTAKVTSKAPPTEQIATRPPREQRVGSFNGVNARMISQIMRRPEVQSLIAQYGMR